MSGALGTWIDGVEGNLVPADDRGLQYGDGVFETVLVRNRVPRFLALHRERLQRGLTRLGIASPAAAVLQADLAAAISMAPPLAVLKLVITRGSSPRRGYAPPVEPVPRRIVSLWPTEPLPRDTIENGVSLDVARLRVPESSPFAGLKHLNRLENVMAAAEGLGRSDFDSLLFDSGDHLVSATACNVFLVKAGAILTPAVQRAGVAGVMRAVVLREAARLAIPATEADLTLRDLATADGMFITNARIGVVPVHRVREHEFAMSEISLRLRQAIEALDA
jgi:4-amino-4-deoxychorismate lyase